MAISPEIARARMPDFTAEEMADADMLERETDVGLPKAWYGGPFTFVWDDTTLRVVAEVARRYEQAGWIVCYLALDSDTEKAEQRIASGKPMEFRVTFTPKWARS